MFLRIAFSFSMVIWVALKQWNDIFIILMEKNIERGILYPLKLSIKCGVD